MKPALLRPALPGLALCASRLLSACTTPYSEAPVATNFPTSKQHKLQAGAHWDAIAKDAATTLVTSLRLGKGCIAAYPDCNQLVLRPPREVTPFSRAFHTLLTTSLVNQGVQMIPYGSAPQPSMAYTPPPMPAPLVSAPTPRVVKRQKYGKKTYLATAPKPVVQMAPVDAMPVIPPAPAPRQELEVDIQVVKFSPDRLDGRYFISGTALGGGVWALQGLWTQTSPQGIATGAALGAAFDAHRWFSSEFARGGVPQLEMIITVSALTNGQYVGRVSNIYYLTDSDLALYMQMPPPPPKPALPVMPLKGGL